MDDLAQRLRTFRQEHNLTLAQVAEKTGLTQGYLSKLERAISEPSISTVLKLAEAYNVNLSELIGQHQNKADQKVNVVRKNERTQLSLPHTKTKIEAIAGLRITKKMNPFVVYPSTEKNAKMLHDPHPGEEFVFVLKGKIKIYIGEKEIELEAGDSIYFDADLPHRILSIGSVQAEVLIIAA